MLKLERFGLKMPVRTVGEHLRRRGFAPQKPIRRAYGRDDAKAAEWKELLYPRIVKKAKMEKAEIHWGDETGIRSDDVHGRSFAPKGKTPLQRVKGTPEKLNMISSISKQGKAHFMFRKGMMNADSRISFLTRLVRSAGRKVILVLDNLRVHRSKALKDWLEKRRKEIEIFHLPACGPRPEPRRIPEQRPQKRLGPEA